METIVDDDMLRVGPTPDAMNRNAELLAGYDYGEYAECLTGYTGQDLQRIAVLSWQPAVRTRVGPRGDYKAGMARLPDGRLVIAVCRDSHDSDHARRFAIRVYESQDTGLTWREIGETPLFGKEPSLTALPDGALALTAQIMGSDSVPVSRSMDGGRTWETTMVQGDDYPRNLIVEPDGSLLMIRALQSDWYGKGGGSPNLSLGRSYDGGKTWEFSEGSVDWDWQGFGEVAAVRLGDGRLLAALRRHIPKTWGEGFEDTVLTASDDDGRHWCAPWQMLNTAQVHAYLTELRDGRLVATYSNYHLPWGVFAVMSEDGGRTWDLDHPVQLALSADFYVGWPVTLELPDGSLITSYASTSYYKQPPETTTCEVVRWQPPSP
jgi:hypothetical protein